MNLRLSRIDHMLKRYDSSLYAVCGAGIIQIFRRTPKEDAWMYGESVIMRDQFLFALTNDWTLSGSPVEWGLDPVMRKLQSMDSWAKEDMYEQFVKQRERNKELMERRHSNERKAIAYDLRREFAKATNDINTSTL